MRILYHHRTLADGAEGVHIAAMVAAFRELGHEVRVAGLTPSAHHGRRYGVVEGLRSVLPRAAFEMASVALNLPEYVQLRLEMRRFHPDLLYKRHSRFDVAALAAARRWRVPAVLEVNTLFATPRYQNFEPLALSRVARTLERQALELATVVVAVSTPLAREAEKVAAATVLVLPNGADPVRFDPHRADGAAVRSRYGLNPALTVGWTGILREWHGLDLLLDALIAVPFAKLLIVGDGPARAAIEQRVAHLGLGNRTVITGRVAHEDVPNHVAAMDIAVVPDERTGVASPMKLLEYMAMARAVVAPRADNIRDVVDDGVDGLLFEPGDTRDLAAQLHRLAADVQLRQALGRSARDKVERERNWSKIAQAVLVAVRVKTAGGRLR